MPRLELKSWRKDGDAKGRGKTRIIGKGERRVDALGKVTGRAKFAADCIVGHQLYGKVLRSKYPHARIIRIDTSKAKLLAGVEAVLTARDIPGEKAFGIVVKNQAILAVNKVRYLGDGVALVAARTEEIAEEAVKRLVVDYEPLPIVSDPEDALKPGAPRIHGDKNAFVHHKVRKGDIGKGFARADFLIERKFKTQFIEHSYLEPEAVLAEPDEHGGVIVTGSIQNLFSSRRSVAAALRLDLNRVQIVQATLGGSFGGKDEVMTVMCCRAALLALAIGKPVKMVNSREESMLESYKRHPYVLYYRWGAKNDGSITAMEIRCIADGGAYASTSPFVTWRSVVQATGPYYCENVKTDVYAVYTNNNYTGAMRGFGSPQVNFAIESMMDELAEKVGKDPLEIRLQNGFKSGAVTATGQRLAHNVSLREVLTKAAEAANFQPNWRKYRRAADAPKKRGIGLACSYRGVSLGAEGVDAAGTIVSVQTDGSVIVSSGITDMGQGAQTQMSQIAAEVLGVSMDRIRFLNTNTSRVPDSGPTVGSRGTTMGGSAAKKAAEIVRTTLLEVASNMLKIDQEECGFADNYLVKKSNGKRIASFTEVAAECFRRGEPMYGFGWHKAPITSWHEREGNGEAYFTFVYGANVAEVEVDTETGKVDVINFVSCHDVGKAINRNTVLGQFYGGVAMGLGYGLLEEFDFESAVPKQLNFDEYLIPTALDVPKIRGIIVENEDAAGPFGAKSVGEPTNEIAAPAIVNAIYNATGKRICEIPATLERVLLGHKLSRKGERGSLQKDLMAGRLVQAWTRRAMKPFDYISVATIAEACSLLSKYGPDASVLAGGTDLLIELRRALTKSPEVLLDISRANELGGIIESDDGILIKPLTTHSQLLCSNVLRTFAPFLVSAASTIGSPQIRNRGTIGGNIMNAATCADTVPPLIALGAIVTLQSKTGRREMDLAELFVKPYQTKAKPDELLTAVRFCKPPSNVRSAFIKLGRRNALSISRLSVAAILQIRDDGRIGDARIVPGSVFPAWKRVTDAEEMLVGEKPAEKLFAAAGKKVSEQMIKETGRRWSTEYKEPVIVVLVKRALEQCALGSTASPKLSPLSGTMGNPYSVSTRNGNGTARASKQCTIVTNINGRSHTLAVSAHWTLLELLRDHLGFTGTKCGCEIGECGACTVLLDGEPVNSCLVLAPQIAGRHVLTVEGLMQRGKLHPLQESFMDCDAVHCGFCTPGMLMSAKALLDLNPHPTETQIRTTISGNLCRCTGYQQIVDAVEKASVHCRRKGETRRPTELATN